MPKGRAVRIVLLERYRGSARVFAASAAFSVKRAALTASWSRAARIVEWFPATP